MKNYWHGTAICEKSMNIVINSLKHNEDSFKIVKKRNNIYLYHDKRLIYRFMKQSCLNKNENFNDLFPLIASIRKNIDNYIDNHKKIKKIKINSTYISESKDNYFNFKSGKYFYEIDIQEAYFQVMHHLGYITDELYKKYSHFDKYKQGYIYGITWLQSDEIVSEYEKGQLINQYNKFRPEYVIIYNNIRYFINNIVDEASRSCTETGFFKKRVDAIYCDYESSKKVCEFYKSKNIEVKITQLIKKDNTFMIKEGKEKRF